MTDAPAAALDLTAYFHRLGYAGQPRPDLATLEALHLAHVGRIPFENLDVLLGRRISLELPELQAKLVLAGRGGYCFEHNSLFAAVLEALGFTPLRLEARVRRGASGGTPARTHGLLQVRLDGRDWLADVGFGADGLLGPVPMDGAESAGHGLRRRVLAEPGGARVLQAWDGAAWQDLYAFAPVPVAPVDWLVANHYTSTHPASKFRRTLTAQLSSPARRLILRGRTLTRIGPEGVQSRELRDSEVLPALRGEFALTLPGELRSVRQLEPRFDELS